MLTDDNLVWFPDPSLQCSSASSAEGPENILLQIIFKLIAGSRGITGGLEDPVCLPASTMNPTLLQESCMRAGHLGAHAIRIYVAQRQCM